MSDLCPICLLEVVSCDDAKLTCNHEIHFECVKILHDDHCPICRAKIQSPLLNDDIISEIRDRRLQYLVSCRSYFDPADYDLPPETYMNLDSHHGGGYSIDIETYSNLNNEPFVYNLMESSPQSRSRIEQYAVNRLDIHRNRDGIPLLTAESIDGYSYTFEVKSMTLAFRTNLFDTIQFTEDIREMLVYGIEFSIKREGEVGTAITIPIRMEKTFASTLSRYIHKQGFIYQVVKMVLKGYIHYIPLEPILSADDVQLYNDLFFKTTVKQSVDICDVLEQLEATAFMKKKYLVYPICIVGESIDMLCVEPNWIQPPNRLLELQKKGVKSQYTTLQKQMRKKGAIKRHQKKDRKFTCMERNRFACKDMRHFQRGRR